MSNTRQPDTGSPDLEANGLVPTMWETMAQAQAASRENEFSDPPAAKARATAGDKEPADKPATPKKEQTDGK